MLRKIIFAMASVIVLFLLIQAQLSAAGVRVTALRQLTIENVYQNNPSWSPNANQIVYTQDPANRPGMGDIWVMNADGTGKNALVTHSAWDERPSWSPGGDKVVFQSNRSVWPGDVWIKDLVTGTETRLTYDGNQNYVTSSQAWSPDATKILFLTNRNTGSIDVNLDTYIMNSDGSTQTLLVPDSTAGAAWSPLGDKIAFERACRIYITNPDGTGETMLAINGGDHLSWSPDGSMIAFVRQGDIWVMNADGTGQTQLTNDPAVDWRPAWSPDGGKIAFASNRNGNFDIWCLQISIAHLICTTFLTPDRLNVMRDPEHSFKIHIYPCDSMDVSVGDSAEVYVDVDTSGSFDPDEKYDAKVSSTDLDGSATDIAIKVYCPDIVDNDPAVAIYSINKVPVADTSDNQIDYLHLETFAPGKHQTTGITIIDQVVLKHNYPNPFNLETEISYSLPEDSRVVLSIYNLIGQKVRTLVDGYQSAGHKTVQWDGRDDQVNNVASGVYFYRFKSDDFVQTKKMILLK